MVIKYAFGATLQAMSVDIGCLCLYYGMNRKLFEWLMSDLNNKTIPLVIALVWESGLSQDKKIGLNVLTQIKALKALVSHTDIIIVYVESVLNSELGEILAGDNNDFVIMSMHEWLSCAPLYRNEACSNTKNMMSHLADFDLVISITNKAETGLTDKELTYLLPSELAEQKLTQSIHGKPHTELLRLMIAGENHTVEYLHCVEPVTKKMVSSSEMTEAKRKEWVDLDSYNQTINQVKEDDLASSYPLLDETQTEKLNLNKNGPLFDCHQRYRQADSLAMQQQYKATRSLKWISIISLLSATVFLLNANLIKDLSLMVLYLSFLVCGFALTWFASTKNYYEKYLHYRSLSEFYRIKFFWLINESYQSTPSAYHYHVTLRTTNSLSWMITAVKNTPIGQPNSQDWQSSQKLVMNHWVADQRKYFEKTLKKFNHARKKIAILSVMTLCTAITSGAVSIGTAVAAGYFPQNWNIMLIKNIFIFMAGWLALMVAILEVYKMKMANEDVRQLNERMLNILRNGETLLAQTDDKNGRHMILQGLLVEATKEILEWFNTKSVHSVRDAQNSFMRLINR